MSKPKSKVLDHFNQFEGFVKCLFDAYAVVDQYGKVVKCNPLFSLLVGQRTKQILKSENLQDIIHFSLNQSRIDLMEEMKNSSQVRFDEVCGITQEKNDLNLIIGLHPFHKGEEFLGGFILIRDVTAESNLQGKYKTSAKEAITDALTKLFNRGYFESYLGNLVHKLESLPQDNAHASASIVMMDIDHFKKINDTYGHQAGDYVIQTVAQLMSENFRQSDILCRYGGEEFLAILPSTPLEGAKIVSEKFRKTIENHHFQFENQSIKVNMCGGVSQILVSQESGADAIARADGALYHSKKNGRNQVSFHDGFHVKSLLDISPNQSKAG